jgi:hypothetical protein
MDPEVHRKFGNFTYNYRVGEAQINNLSGAGQDLISGGKMLRSVVCFIAAVIISLSLSGCAAPATPAQLSAPTAAAAPGRSLASGGSLTGVDIRRAGAAAFEPLQAGQAVGAGDSLRSASSAAAPLAELRGQEGTLILIAPGTTLLVELLSPTTNPPQTRLRLEQGALLAAAEQPLGQGFLEIRTPDGLAAIHGSAMAVSFHDNQTTVACLEGSAALTGAQNTVVLPAGYKSSTSPASAGGDPSPAQKFEEDLAKKDPLLWETLNDRYYHPGIAKSPTLDLRPSDTPVPSWTPSPVPAATWTPFALGPSPTPVISGGIPTRRPTTTALPGASGPTLEELANQGLHTYQVACQAWNKCVCDSANANPVVEMQITFASGRVSLAEKDGKNALDYTRQAPNLFSVLTASTTAEITFLAQGWEFWVTQGGSACQLQTFTKVK